MSSASETSLQGSEPPMFLQRPSSARSQDVSHVLARTFRELFMRDAVGSDTVHYLTKSRGGDNAYHEKYVEALQQVQEIRDRRMAEAAMLERHIMQAQARAMSADERELNRVSSGVQRFPDLGLPPARAHFRSCIDAELLRKHNLITPEDFATEESPAVPPPQEPDVPSYARETMSSSKKKTEEEEGAIPSPLPPMFANQMKPGDSLSSLESSNKMSEYLAPHQLSSWKQELNPETREVNRTDLTNLQKKVDYLKNPRYVPPSEGGRMLTKSSKKAPKEIGIKPKLEKEKTKEPTAIFVPSPPVIKFTEYLVGQVYEMTLELKNVTSVLRPVRVIPPKTTYFAVGLGQFPGEHGLVAPGMSCHYTVRFAPDSLGDFDDVLVVQTQSSAPLIIQLQGRRTCPILTLPETLDIGECLIGGCKIARIPIYNTGGPGRFCIMNRSQWPATNFKSIMSSGCVSSPPFEVRPSVFELATGEMILIEVLFTPPDTKRFDHTITVVCDNCQVQHFTITGQGQTAGVDLMSVEGDVAEAAPGELCDTTAHHLIKFDNLNPYTYFQRRITVKNKANVEVPYNWVVVKPLLKPPDPEAEQKAEAGEDDAETSEQLMQDRIHDPDSAFSIEPAAGTLPPDGESEFAITFAPPQEKAFHSVLHMILREVPVILPPKEETRDELKPSSSRIRHPEPTPVQDMTALEIDLKGTCEPFSVILQPYAIYIPGQITVNTPAKRTFRMINLSVSSIVFEWEKVSNSYICQVEPPGGELGARGEMDFELTVMGSCPGKVNETMYCRVHHLAEPLTLHVETEIKGPEVVVENSDVNFGLIRMGDTRECAISVQNLSQVSAKWSIKEAAGFPNAEFDNEFIFTPSQGELRPLETSDVQISFTPQCCRSVRSIFTVSVEDGNQSSLLVRGEVQTPQACLLSCELHLPEVYVDVPVIQQVALLNQTLLPTDFEWGEVEGSQADLCSVSLEPAKGHLGPREQLEITVHFTGHHKGEISELRVPCFIGGQKEALYLAITCDTRGLQVSYRTPPADDNIPESDELCIDFGDEVPVGDTPVRQLYIRNNTAIRAPFTISVDYFYAKPPTPPGEKRVDGNMPNKSQRRALLGRTPNLADPLSKTPAKAHNDLCRAMLQLGNGAAFTVSPASGMLEPFGEQLVEIKAFSDMWGQYNDLLICKIRVSDGIVVILNGNSMDLPSVFLGFLGKPAVAGPVPATAGFIEKLDLIRIPIKMGVHGCPLQFQMVAAQPNQKPILRFGTHVSGIGPITRQMRINNSAPYDIRLDWQMFNQNDQDDQLLDLVVTYGKPFPMLDRKGQEIVPKAIAEKSKSALMRYPTDYISDSPDVTPAHSRQVTKMRTMGALDEEPSQPKVISVTLREHGGEQSTELYDITPSQVVIPARGNGCISVSFTPPSNEKVNIGADCQAFSLGYLSLEDAAKEVKGKVERDDAYNVSQLRLDMTAFVKPALLTLECTDDEGMRYRAAASDLYHNGQMIMEKLHMSSAVLSNHTETPLIFRLLTADPFHLVELDDSGKPVSHLLQTDYITLRQNENALIQVAFRVSLDLLTYLELLESEREDDSIREVAELEVNGTERKIHFKNELIVEFNNTTSQKLPLYATLTVPTLVLSKESLDFGICLVGQRRELQLTLENSTGSDSYWTASLDNQSSTCNDTTFSVTPSSGRLDVHIMHVSNSKVLIKVYFTARHTEDYEAVYVFHGMLGERPCHLYLRGQGSYDGKHEAIVDV